MSAHGKVEDFELIPTYTRAIKVTRENSKTVAARLGCRTIETTEAYDEGILSYVTSFKFFDKEGAVRFTMVEGDYLIYTSSSDGFAQTEVAKEVDFESKFQSPSIHLTSEEYEDFLKMRRAYLYPERVVHNDISKIS